jgi:hypothetical protein
MLHKKNKRMLENYKCMLHKKNKRMLIKIYRYIYKVRETKCLYIPKNNFNSLFKKFLFTNLVFCITCFVVQLI